jgi:hypothetical protein
MASYQDAYKSYGSGAGLDPGGFNTAVYGRFRSRFNRDPNQTELDAFKGANAIDWTKPVNEQQHNSAMSWIDAYQPQGATQQTPPDVAPAPSLSLSRMSKPSTFVPRQFVAPTMADAEADPGYAFGRKQVEDAVMNSASAQGISRAPQAREALIQRIGDYSQQRYGDVYARKFGEYQAGLGADERAYATNFGTDAAVTGFNNDATSAEFEPQMLAWDRGADRDWQRYVYGQDSGYRDRAFNANEYWRQRDDYWRDRDEGESRRRFLAQLGRS